MLLEEDSRLIVSEDSGSVEGLFFVTLVCVCVWGEGSGGGKKEKVVRARSDGIFNSHE